MEPKKNPAYDVHRMRGPIFNLSLGISLALVITAFHWTAPSSRRPPRPEPPREADMVFYPPVSVHPKKEKDPAMKVKTKQPVLAPRDFKVVTKEIEPSDEKLFTEPDAPTDIEVDGVEVPPEPLKDTVFLVVENMPVPEGGYARFYQTIRDNFKYPRAAKQSQTTGKVFVGFTVSETGTLKDIHVVKGIGRACDEEAMRVISLTKWSPGKQRGRAVKVRMVQPILFELRE